MYTTYHLLSAQEVNADILESIKATFKTKPITIILAETEEDFELTTEMKTVLEERLQKDEATYLTAKDSIKHLKIKYGI